MSLADRWVKSSYSDPNGGNCVEARQPRPGTVQVRDSKHPGPVVLSVTSRSWQDFLASVRAGA